MCDAVLKGDAAPVNALPSWAFGRPSQRLHRYGLGLGLLGVGGEGCADDILRLDGPLLSGARCAIGRPRRVAAIHRSEEHTSELQSLMRISYAVFCLKKKQTKNLR